MDISSKGEVELRNREGERLHAYADTTGHWTIGVGHTGRVDGIPIHAGMVITQSKCDSLFRQDLEVFAKGVTKLLRHSVTQWQFDACVSLAYNLGLGGFSGSLVRAEINKGRMDLAATAFLHYEHPKELRGRRESEMKQFEGKLYQ